MSLWQLVGVVLALALAAALVVWRERARALAGATGVFVGEVREEVKKITWPGKDELRRATLVILAFVLVVAIIIGLMDLVLQFLVVRLPGRIA